VTPREMLLQVVPEEGQDVLPESADYTAIVSGE
jgi:hypothetical protein